MTAKAEVIGAFGARGTGKTAWAMQIEAATPCLAIWDYKHDPRMARWGTAYDDLAAFIRALDAPRFTARYLVQRGGAVPIDVQFDLFCRACFQRGNLRMFVDELPAVTRAYKAPPAWRECVNIGREYQVPGERGIKRLGITITAQRSGEIDKALIGNIEVVHAGRLPFENDARAVAGQLGVDWRELTMLPDLHWIERRADRRAATRGVLSFGNRSSVEVKKKTSGAVAPKAPAKRTP